jgi:hypothetical protein
LFASADEVAEFIKDEGRTAICPECGAVRDWHFQFPALEGAPAKESQFAWIETKNGTLLVRIKCILCHSGPSLVLKKGERWWRFACDCGAMSGAFQARPDGRCALKSLNELKDRPSGASALPGRPESLGFPLFF